MDVKPDNGLTNVMTRLAVEILKSHAAGISVVALKHVYQCTVDIHTGIIEWENDSQGKVHTIPNPRHLSIPESDVKTALRTAALISLVSSLHGLNDETINKVIDRYPFNLETGVNVRESMADMIMAKILLESKPSRTFGFLSVERTSAQLAVHKAFTEKDGGLQSIRNFADVTEICEKIPGALKPAEQKLSPKSG